MPAWLLPYSKRAACTIQLKRLVPIAERCLTINAFCKSSCDHMQQLVHESKRHNTACSREVVAKDECRLASFMRYTTVRTGRDTFAPGVAYLADDCAKAYYQSGNMYNCRRGAETRSESETNLLEHKRVSPAIR